MKSSSAKIRVLIADDHAIVRMGLAALLSPERDIEVVGQAKNGVEAVREALRLRPDIVVMDLMMPKKDGAEATAEIHRAAPDVKILILTTYGTSDGIARALAAGATGAFMKSAENSELAAAIRAVAEGRKVVAPEIRRQLATDPPVPELTPRQLDVLGSIVRGLTNHDIARELGICPDRVKDHINAILLKIGAANRTEAVAIALRKHLLKI